MSVCHATGDPLLMNAKFRVGPTVSKPILSLLSMMDRGAELWLSAKLWMIMYPGGDHSAGRSPADEAEQHVWLEATADIARQHRLDIMSREASDFASEIAPVSAGLDPHGEPARGPGPPRRGRVPRARVREGRRSSPEG